jgi:hypothetical protein
MPRRADYLDPLMKWNGDESAERVGRGPRFSIERQKYHDGRKKVICYMLMLASEQDYSVAVKHDLQLTFDSKDGKRSCKITAQKIVDLINKEARSASH